VALVETIKVNLGIPSPVEGRVVETNGDLCELSRARQPGPYGKGWLAVIEIEDPGMARQGLKTAREFMTLAKAQADAEMPR
jgi:glycine cleavage system H lipoate-binding protein